MNTKLKPNTLKGKQSGIVAITVTMIIMVVIGLIIVGFAQLSRREQQQSLDRQLSSQAYYAAETGINDAFNAVKAYHDGTGPSSLDLDSKDYSDDCQEFIKDAKLAAEMDAASGVGYTCLFVDSAPGSIEFSNVDTDSQKVLPIEPEDGGSVKKIIISWEDKDSDGKVFGCKYNELPTSDNWPNNCDPGIMRVDLVPTTSDTLNRDDLIDDNMTVFLYPSGSGLNSANFNTYKGFSKSGAIIETKCDGNAPAPGHKKCHMEITGLSEDNYTMRLRSMYKPSVVTITAHRNTYDPLSLKGVQLLIDSTGKAQDVLRRAQVRAPISQFNIPYPEFAVQTVDTLCKRFSVAPPDEVNWNDAGEAACRLSP